MSTHNYGERFITIKGVFDGATNRAIFELSSRKHFDDLICPIEIGKESNVFLAQKDNKKVIVKIYRSENRDFKRMFEYIKKDPRYGHLKNKYREIVFAWTQREYRNLLIAKEGKVRVPNPIACRANIIVEEMIGDQNPAPRLKDCRPENPKKFFEDIIKEVRKMYQINLIHGDLSAFNILNYNEKPVLIDFSQATLIKTPNSEELLVRDINNLINHFKKWGIEANFSETFLKVTTGK